jgi:hypothetical protein
VRSGEVWIHDGLTPKSEPVGMSSGHLFMCLKALNTYHKIGYVK